MQKRWYDIDPTVHLAVSLLEKAETKKQLECANYIIDKAKSYGVRITENDLSEAFNYILRRWYDKNKQIRDALEYLKTAPYDVQLGIAFDIIDKLQIPETEENKPKES